MNVWRFDLRSFLLGVLSSTILFFLIHRFRNLLDSLWQTIQSNLQSSLFVRSNLEVQLRKDLIRFCQKEHLLGQMFALDDLLISTRCIPLLSATGVDEVPFEDVTAEVVPVIFDDPLLASSYRTKSYSVLEILAQGNSRLILLGEYGVGKTTALLEAAMKIARLDHPYPSLYTFLPLYVHATRFMKELEKRNDIIAALIESAREFFSTSVRRSIPGIARKALREQRMILFLDGIDEIPPQQVDRLADTLKTLLQQHPEIKIVTVATPNYLSDFIAMDFSPLSICMWDKTDTRMFLEKWQEGWKKTNFASPEEIDLWTAWAKQESAILTPLEWTLFLLFLYSKIPTPPRPFRLYETCLQSTPIDHSDNKEIAGWTVEIIKNYLQNGTPPSPPGALDKLFSDEFIVKPPPPELRFTSPIYISLFASYIPIEQSDRVTFLNSKWAIAVQAVLLSLLRHEKETLHFELDRISDDQLIDLARILTSILPSLEDKKQLITRLVNLIRDDQKPKYLRAKAYSALLHLPSEERLPLIKLLLQSKEAFLRQLGALGYGLLRSEIELQPLLNLLEDPHLNCFQAACLALVNIGTAPALDAVISALIHGHDRLKDAAAQSLANDPMVGHAILREAAQHEDPRVRKACIGGLLRINSTWSKEVLQQMAIEEKAWLVKDAAANAVTFLDAPDPRIPQKRPETARLPWLIQFAAQKGIGLAPGKSNQDVLLLALEEGSPEIQQAALEFLQFTPLELAIPLTEKLLGSSNQDLRSTAYQTLWSFKVCRKPR
ncbi:MAG: PBS lyase HEAT domain protein repeat-containing protein [Anaerolineae bacterium]|nr:MAG: PBS lyase HEAT domain protein repeat-containing protein [Anaerolineae bacterium]